MLLKQSEQSPVQTRQGQDLQHVLWSSEIDFIMAGLEETPPTGSCAWLFMLFRGGYKFDYI